MPSTLDTELQTRFMGLWRRLGALGSGESCFQLLRAHYAEPPRAYHTLAHVWWGLQRIDEIVAHEPSAAELSPAIELAMWFHDVVMRFGRASDSDEAASARLATELIEAAGLGTDLARRVERLILATAHQHGATATASDEAILVDADLSILGANPAAFDAYEQHIRQEWSHVGDELFRAGRSHVLQQFVSRPRIFATDYAHQRWEQRARLNLERSLRNLQRAAP